MKSLFVKRKPFFSNFFNMFCPQFYSFHRPLNGSSLVPDWSHIWPMVRWPRPCPFCCSSLPRWIECPPARPACEWELCPHRMAVQSLSYCPWLPRAWTVNSSHIFIRFSFCYLLHVAWLGDPFRHSTRSNCL